MDQRPETVDAVKRIKVETPNARTTTHTVPDAAAYRERIRAALRNDERLTLNDDGWTVTKVDARTGNTERVARYRIQ